MNERSSNNPKRAKKDSDFATVAFRVVEQAIAAGEPVAPAEPSPPEPTAEELHAIAVTLGRAGGKKGGKARADRLSAERRREIAKKAAGKRWGNSD